MSSDAPNRTPSPSLGFCHGQLLEARLVIVLQLKIARSVLQTARAHFWMKKPSERLLG